MDKSERRIGLTMRTQQAEGYHEPRDALAQAWASYLEAALPEACWMYLPSLGAGKMETYCEGWGLDGLILTGGEDLDSSALRDESERALLKWAASRGVPVLGICRGLQMMTHAAGGQLTTVGGHVRARHVLTGRYSHEVNSFHTTGVTDCPEGYHVLAQAPDGSIEAIGHDTLPWEGWMWHPEREASYSADDINATRRIFS
ncbi:gamma-glutamyl-gamma-aminobutyrate hydrolase family protein [Roseovarius sp. S1116L3]|uniref:gamma-glutamyl-gamma-aminobutyrate hydrolase family protein n=1 Tax=Roseovarius roseus TaxID=3342636 RepID=UPI00372AFE88